MLPSSSAGQALINFPTHPQVRDVDWDHELGSNLLDMALAKHFTAEFAAKHKLDLDSILGNAKVMAKMKKQVWIQVS